MRYRITKIQHVLVVVRCQPNHKLHSRSYLSDKEYDGPRDEARLVDTALADALLRRRAAAAAVMVVVLVDDAVVDLVEGGVLEADVLHGVGSLSQPVAVPAVGLQNVHDIAKGCDMS